MQEPLFPPLTFPPPHSHTTPPPPTHPLQAVAAISSFISSSTLVTAMAILSLSVLWWAVYKPLLRRLDCSIKKGRALLLLIPDGVARSVPRVMAAVRASAADKTAAGSSL